MFEGLGRVGLQDQSPDPASLSKANVQVLSPPAPLITFNAESLYCIVHFDNV